MLFEIVKEIKKYFKELGKPIVGQTIDIESKTIVLLDCYGNCKKLYLSKYGKYYSINSVDGEWFYHEIQEIDRIIKRID